MMRTPCCEKMGLKKGPWTPDEDEKLLAYIQHHGHGSWRSLPKHAGLRRCGKSCRLRWTNYLRPDIKRGNFSCEEEQIIINLHSLLGNRWSSIASHLPGRTDNEIKNYWNTHLKKRLLQMGLDPMNHKPLLDGYHTLALPSMGKAPSNLMFSAHHSRDERDGVSRHIGESHTRNKSQDCFLRKSDDSGASLLRAMTFPSSYLEQLRSCGLDISGFLTQHYKQAIRLQKQEENERRRREEDAQLQQNQQPISLIDAKHAPNDIILQTKSMTTLSSDGSNNSTTQCVGNLSPCSPLSSFGFSSLHQGPKSNVWSKKKLTFSDRGIGSRKRREEDECEIEQDVHITCAIPCNTFVGEGQIHAKPVQASDKITQTNPQQMMTVNCTPCELLPLSSTSLQCSQTLGVEQQRFMTPKHMMNVIVKEEEMLCGSRSTNNGHDLGLNCFMPLLTPDMCLGFEVEMEGNGGGVPLNQVSQIGKTW